MLIQHDSSFLETTTTRQYVCLLFYVYCYYFIVYLTQRFLLKKVTLGKNSESNTYIFLYTHYKTKKLTNDI